jgi:chemotaxis methyl-accepting protein methylase
MIGATGFFRDEGAWKALSEKALAPLIAARESGSSIRICSSNPGTYGEAERMRHRATRSDCANHLA